MEANKLGKSVLLIWLVFLMCLAITCIPNQEHSGLKPFSIAEDILKDSSGGAHTGKTGIAKVVDTFKSRPRPNAPKGMQVLEYFGENKNALDPFFAKLPNSRNRRVRIAFFGDSYIEADMILAQFRDTLQRVFGGRGVGYVPFTSMTASARPTILHKFSGWNTASLLDKKRSTLVHISGFSFRADSGAFAEWAAPAYLGWPSLKAWNRLRIYYHSKSNGNLYTSINGTAKELMLPLAPRAGVVEVDQANMSRVRLSGSSNVVFLGASLQDETGIYVDNFSLRGSSGTLFTAFEPFMLQAYDSIEPYDLIVLQFGLNVSAHNTTDPTWYEKEFDRSVARLRKAFPNKPILLVSVGDRSQREKGEYVTMANIPLILALQKRAAAKYNLAFWNTFEAVGGEGAMPNWVQKGWAAKDYTHMSFQGGGVLAGMLARSLLWEYALYQKNHGGT
jgi:lysophospholipase L1-like esterase